MGVSVSQRSSVLGIDIQYKNLRGSTAVFLPQRLAIVGQGASASTYATTPQQFTDAFSVGSLYGFGSPLHLAAKQLFPVNGKGIGVIPAVFFPLEDDASGVVADGDITPSGTQTEAAEYVVYVNRIPSNKFVVAAGVVVVADVVADMVAAINANPDMPIIAVDNTTSVTFTSKWKGVSANDIFVEVGGDATLGSVFTITQANGGLVNPDVDDALDQFGEVWYSLVLNCMEYDDTASLTKYATFGEGRWVDVVQRQLAVVSGVNEDTQATVTAISDARKTDRINFFVVAPGSHHLPFVIAAEALTRIAKVANENPARDYQYQVLQGISAGLDSEQWKNTVRNDALLKGCSSSVLRDNEVNLGDTIMFYHPTGDPNPAYRYLKDIIKLQQVSFNLQLAFENAEWAGAPLVPDGQVVNNNPDAKSPSDAKAVVFAIIDGLADAAIISDPRIAKESVVCNINNTNQNRLDIELTIQLSGNANVISVDLFFGFYFGS